MTIWFIDANVTVGSIPSEALGLHHQEPESETGVVFSHVFAVLPATFYHDPTGAATWTSRTGTTRRYDFVALPRTVVPMVESAGVDS